MRLVIKQWLAANISESSQDFEIKEAICSAFERVWGGLALLWGANALYLIAVDKITPWLSALIVPLPVLAVAMVALGAAMVALAGRDGQRTLLARSIVATGSVFCWACIFICILGAGPTSGTPVYFVAALVPALVAAWRIRTLGRTPQDD